MDREYINLAFEDELGKNATLRVDSPKADLDGDAVEGAATAIVDAGVFRKKGRFTKLLAADIVTVSTRNLVDNRDA